MRLEDYMLPCLNKRLFGFDCLGCGFQRALVALIRGDFQEAFVLYPAIYSILILVVYFFINLKFNFTNSQKIFRLLLIINLLLIVGNFCLKNF